MECSQPPVLDVQWAEGHGRAWFCRDHFEQWAPDHTGDIDRAFAVTGGRVSEKLGGPGERALVLLKDRQKTGDHILALLDAAKEERGLMGRAGPDSAFFFIPMGHEERLMQAAAEVGRRLRSQGITGEPVPQEELHCTLAYLEVATDAQVQRMLHGLALPLQFNFRIRGLGRMGDAVLFHLDPDPALIRLQRDLWMAGKNAGVQFNDKGFDNPRAYKPHISVAYGLPEGTTLGDLHLDEWSFTHLDEEWVVRATAVNVSRSEGKEAVVSVRLPTHAGDPLFIERTGQYAWPHSTPQRAPRIHVSPEEWKSLLAGGVVMLSQTRRMVTLDDGPFVVEGGPGSGHHGHRGIPGHRGGSAPDEEKPAEEPKAPWEPTQDNRIVIQTAKMRPVVETVLRKTAETLGVEYKGLYITDNLNLAVKSVWPEGTDAALMPMVARRIASKYRGTLAAVMIARDSELTRTIFINDKSKSFKAEDKLDQELNISHELVHVAQHWYGAPEGIDPPRPYVDSVNKLYGRNPDLVRGEYQADLLSHATFGFQDEADKRFSSRTGIRKADGSTLWLPGVKFTDADQAAMDRLKDYYRSATRQAPRYGAAPDSMFKTRAGIASQLVFFPWGPDNGELLSVPDSMLDQLGPDAEVIPWPDNAPDEITNRGGPGSGNFGHEGRPGEVGGSAPPGVGEPIMVGKEGRNAYAAGKRLSDAIKSMPEVFKAVGILDNDRNGSGWLLPDGSFYLNYSHTLGAKIATEATGVTLDPTVPTASGSREIDAMLAFGIIRVVKYKGYHGDAELAMSLGRTPSDEQKSAIQDWLAAWPDGYVVADYTPSYGEHVFVQDRTKLPKIGIIERGGPGSGHHGHRGRPGERGGSEPAEGKPEPMDNQTIYAKLRDFLHGPGVLAQEMTPDDVVKRVNDTQGFTHLWVMPDGTGIRVADHAGSADLARSQMKRFVYERGHDKLPADLTKLEGDIISAPDGYAAMFKAGVIRVSAFATATAVSAAVTVPTRQDPSPTMAQSNYISDIYYRLPGSDWTIERLDNLGRAFGLYSDRPFEDQARASGLIIHSLVKRETMYFFPTPDPNVRMGRLSHGYSVGAARSILTKGLPMKNVKGDKPRIYLTRDKYLAQRQGYGDRWKKYIVAVVDAGRIGQPGENLGDAVAFDHDIPPEALMQAEVWQSLGPGSDPRQHSEIDAIVRESPPRDATLLYGVALPVPDGDFIIVSIPYQVHPLTEGTE